MFIWKLPKRPLQQSLQRSRVALIAFIGFWMLLQIGPAPAQAASGSQPVIRVVQDSGSLKALAAEVTIDAPVNAVWANLVNYGNLKNMLPGYERSTVLQASGDTKTVDLGLKGGGLLPPLRYQVKIHEDKLAHAIFIQRVSGDFKAINASYQLSATGGGTQTRVLYTIRIDLGDRLPAFGAGHLLKGSTARAMNALQAYCVNDYRRSLAASAQ